MYHQWSPAIQNFRISIKFNVLKVCVTSADSRFASSQWETSLPSRRRRDAVSHWLGAYQESAMITIRLLLSYILLTSNEIWDTLNYKICLKRLATPYGDRELSQYWCLPAPSHYHDQCSSIINVARWHLAEVIETAIDITHHRVFENHIP